MNYPGVVVDAVASFFRVAMNGFGIRFYGGTSGSVGLKPAANAGSTDYTLPSAAPTVTGQALISDTAGVMSFSGPFIAAASPVFTGNPTAPTPTAGDTSSSLATTQFVATAINNDTLLIIAMAVAL